jgi:hypothetical protein
MSKRLHAWFTVETDASNTEVADAIQAVADRFGEGAEFGVRELR